MVHLGLERVDMLLNIPLITDLLTLTKHHQALINKHLIRSNQCCTKHEFKVDQQVFVTNHARLNKLDLVKSGPYPIIQVHTNNTVSVKPNLASIFVISPRLNHRDTPWSGRMSQMPQN